MNIWIIKEGEFVSLLTGKSRASRAAMLADYFIEAGHQVTAWSSLWNHDIKEFIKEDRQVIELKPGLSLSVLDAKKVYKKNVSLARIAQGREIGRIFRDEAKKMPKPDLIYSCWPLIETSYEAVKYGKGNGIPVVIDIRDLWPDIFIQPFPRFLQPLARLGINFVYKKKVCYALKKASMVTGTIPKAMELPPKYGRQMKAFDHHVFHCYKNPSFTETEISSAIAEWNLLGVDASSFNIVFFGSTNKRICELEMMIDAAKKLENCNVKFIICGRGVDYNELVDKSKSCPNFIMAGLKNQLQLVALASISKVGIIPYRNTSDFTDSLPTKFSEYLANSLIVFTSLRGLSKTVIEENQCGFAYEEGSADSLVSAVEKYLEDVSLVEKQKTNAKLLYEKTFNADVVYRDFVSQLIKLAEEKKSTVMF